MSRDEASNLFHPLASRFNCAYNLPVLISYDPKKNARNIEKRGLSFEDAANFEFESALITVDDRRDYGEVRFVALGLLGERLHVLCFTEQDEGIRVISFRRANPREVKRYVQSQAVDRL